HHPFENKNSSHPCRLINPSTLDCVSRSATYDITITEFGTGAQSVEYAVVDIGEPMAFDTYDERFYYDFRPNPLGSKYSNKSVTTRFRNVQFRATRLAALEALAGSITSRQYCLILCLLSP